MEIELKNIILRRVSIFEFLHSQGQNRTWADALAMSALPPKTDIPANGRLGENKRQDGFNAMVFGSL